MKLPTSAPQIAGSAALSLLLLATGAPAWGLEHALLVGVSNYPALPGKSLQGPANDVGLMARLVDAWGFAPERVALLSEAAGALPTRANILRGLARLARDAKADDWVLIYLSGHGAQVPHPVDGAGAQRVSTGLDEVFLPRDTQLWNPATQQVQGAVRDKELGAAVRRILSKGANVWVVLDTCHAGDMLRKPERAVEWRFVSPQALHIPMQLWGQWLASSWRLAGGGRASQLRSMPAQLGAPAGAVEAGRYVAFFSAQKDEATMEELLPDPAAPASPKRFGLFTYKLAQASDAWSGSFAALAERLELAYQDRPFPTPQFVGALDARPPFGARMQAAAAAPAGRSGALSVAVLPAVVASAVAR